MRIQRLAGLLILGAFAAACESITDPGPQVPVTIHLVSGDAQQAVVGTQLANPLVVRITDVTGLPIPGVAVNFQVVSGGGSVFAATSTTDQNGEAQNQWTLGTSTADSQRVEVRVVGANGQTLSTLIRATALPDAAVAITALGPAVRAGSAGAPLADSLAARVLDRYGNGVPGATVVWSVVRGGGTVSPTQSTTDALGIARTRWTLGTRVDSTQVAQASLSPAVSAQFTATAGVPLGAQLTRVSGDGQNATAGAELGAPLVVRLALADGRPLVGATITWAIASGGGSVTPPTSVTDADGRAQTTWRLGTPSGPQGVVASIGSLSAIFTANAAPGTPTTFAKAGGDGQTAPAGSAAADSLAVRVTDAFGNPVPGTVVTWTVLSGGGTVSSAQSTTDANGVARTRWTLGMRVDSIQSVEAGVSSALRLQFNAQATVPSNAQLVVVSGNGQAAPVGTQLPAPVVIELQLPDGRGIIGAPVTISVSPNSGTLAPTSAVTDANGQVSATWTMGQQAGTATATAASPGVPSLQLTATATAGAPAAITRVSGNEQRASVHVPMPLPLVVRVTDAFGNVVPGATVTWTASKVSAFTPNPSTTDAQGLAQTQWTAQDAGVLTATASLATGQTANFTASVAWDPQSVTITNPNSTVVVGDSLNLEVVVIGANGQPLPNAPVRWGGGVNGGILVDSITGMARAYAYAFGNPAVVLARLENRSDTVTLTTAWPRLAELTRSGTCGLNAASVVVCFGNGFPSLPFGFLPVTHYIAGANYVCGVLADGRYACWTQGNPNTTYQPNTLNREVLSSSACFLDTSGRAYCSGTQVPGGFTFDSISSGYAHNCALTAAGDAYCWGLDQMGQLGSSATTETCQRGPVQFGPCSSVPLAVEGGLDFVQISAGGEHTCALTAGGAAYCWGSNQFGQLGTPTSPNLCARGGEPPSLPCALAPVPVQQGALQFKVIEAAAYHTCAVTTDNRAYCWGRNNGGQLGNGNKTDSSVPVAVAGGLFFKDVGAIMDMLFDAKPITTALTTDGRVFRWGNEVLTPTQIAAQP
jgi:hypothetical protein